MKAKTRKNIRNFIMERVREDHDGYEVFDNINLKNWNQVKSGVIEIFMQENGYQVNRTANIFNAFREWLNALCFITPLLEDLDLFIDEDITTRLDKWDKEELAMKNFYEVVFR